MKALASANTRTCLSKKNDIDFDILADIDEQDLQKLGVSFGHRKKLLKAIARNFSSRPATDGRSEVMQLTRAATVKPERRHLTVLFCDLVGSTALSTQLDPEDLRLILYHFQRCCSNAIRLFDGHIARFLGDGVLAYFGFPASREGDAERAVNAGLKIIETVPALNTFQRLEVRIGIASGLVVAGDLIGEGSAAEFALVGMAPDLAARLQSLAGPNQILIIGEPGIGKSRLAKELIQRVPQPQSLMSFQCSSQHISSAWYPVMRYFEQATGIEHDAAPEAKLDGLEALIRELIENSDETIALLAGLLSTPLGGRYPPLDLTPQQQKRRTFGALLALFRARAEKQPTFIIFEDVHWIDPTTLEQLPTNGRLAVSVLEGFLLSFERTDQLFDRPPMAGGVGRQFRTPTEAPVSQPHRLLR